MEIIEKYFKDLPAKQIQLLSRLEPLYREWNGKINVISRKDISHFYERHVLHSLGITRVIRFKPGTSVLDVGTGGGFPGIPLAIFFPETSFHLVDSIGKKIRVVQGIIDALELKNVKAEQVRAEQIKDKYDFIVSRAVTAFPEFVAWVRKNVSAKQKNELLNGILYLKGGDFSHEIKSLNNPIRIYELSSFFEEEFFETKKLIHMGL